VEEYEAIYFNLKEELESTFHEQLDIVRVNDDNLSSYKYIYLFPYRRVKELRSKRAVSRWKLSVEKYCIRKT